MAELLNQRGTLRFRLVLADRESGGERWLAHAGVEHLDALDGEWIPFIRIPVYRLAAAEARELSDSMGRLVREESKGFAFKSELSPQLGLQLGREGEGVVVEVGVDLAAWLAAWSKTRGTEGEDLALFRFKATQAALVSFASAWKTEVGELSARAR